MCLLKYLCVSRNIFLNLTVISLPPFHSQNNLDHGMVQVLLQVDVHGMVQIDVHG
jgi:hypothetical protein